MSVKSHPLFSLSGQPKHARDERHLPHDVSFLHATHLAFNLRHEYPYMGSENGLGHGFSQVVRRTHGE